MDDYARFYKCDLQMQSPLSAHWRESGTKISVGDPLDRKREVAREYLKACHDAEIEIVGLTDHNFAPDSNSSFVQLLQSENESVAEECGKPQIIIFPGFEIEANVGKGCHVICLFAPDVPLDVVDSRLSLLGLPPDQRFDNGTPKPALKDLKEIIEVVQNNEANSGIVIAAHPTSTHGLFDNDNIAEWLQVEEFVNPNLHCIEVPKPLDQMSEGWQHLISADEDCLPQWKRERSVACIMSSDCYRLKKADEDPSNYIGFRHTWIRVNHPSVESLRQAFLDHASRIRLGETRPELEFDYPKIRSVRIQNSAYLQRLESINWSPNLNCIIGSRGTGKSTLVDYMRLALDQMRDEDLPESFRKEIQSRVFDTMSPDTRIELGLETPGGNYRLVYNHLDQTRKVYVEGATEPIVGADVRTLFPCKIISQREIDHSIGKTDRAALRKILDDFVRGELLSLEQEEQEIHGRIQGLDVTLTAKREQQANRNSFETQRLALQGELDAQKKLVDSLEPWSGVEAERKFFESLFAECQTVITRFDDAINSAALASTSENESVTKSPNSDLIANISKSVNDALEKLLSEIRTAVEEFASKTTLDDSDLKNSYNSDWVPKYEEVSRRFKAAEEEAASQGKNLE